ncbi:hypothetical protein EJ06DRAFT_526326, partial [Trichodelitschia bisporula]
MSPKFLFFFLPLAPIFLECSLGAGKPQGERASARKYRTPDFPIADSCFSLGQSGCCRLRAQCRLGPKLRSKEVRAFIRGQITEMKAELLGYRDCGFLGDRSCGGLNVSLSCVIVCPRGGAKGSGKLKL